MNQAGKIPSHIGIILDGNRRWAKEHNLPTLEGHRQGYDNLKNIAKLAINRGVKYLSVFAFSIENWQRTGSEVKYLMTLAYTILTRDVAELDREGIRVVWLGTSQRLSQKLQKAIAAAVNKTKDNTRGTLAVCFNYSGQQEIVDAAKQLINEGVAATKLTPKKFTQALYAPDVPPIDLLIRTSGEQRLSGFMLWRAAYAELHFVAKHWPDFTEADLDAAITEYAKRQRRFGK